MFTADSLSELRKLVIENGGPAATVNRIPNETALRKYAENFGYLPAENEAEISSSPTEAMMKDLENVKAATGIFHAINFTPRTAPCRNEAGTPSHPPCNG